ncbi:MAG TPA: hypothetical protein VKB93_17680 [Thermoanaerobaculia bacterium]|nr:hypothetical protein [Thermoanaerobaculia bacterium]
MTQFHIDMGYDWDAVSGQLNLQWGVLAMVTVNNQLTAVPAYVSDFKPGDTVQFFIYDLSPLNDGTQAPNTTPSLPTAWMASVAADSATKANGFVWPFDAPSVSLITGGTCSVIGAGGTNPPSKLGSTVFPGGPYYCWQVQVATFVNGNPVLQVLTANVLNLGSFNLTFQVTASLNSSTTTQQTYTVDPEMIVTSTGGIIPVPTGSTEPV